jgi:outer membrane lipoprotein-sorting protein
MIRRTRLRASLICRALLLAAMPFVAACPKPAVRPYPPPTAEELMAALRARADHLKTLRATAKVDYFENEGNRVKIKVNMLLARGGKLRFEADNPLGGALATLTSDGHQFSMLDLRSNRFLTGPAKACNVARLIRLAIPPDDVVAVLMGGAPLDGTVKGVTWDPSDGGREVLTLSLADGGEETLKLDAHDKRWDVVRAERRDAAGKVLWRVTNEGFADHGGVRLPSTSDVQEPPHGADAEIKFRSVEPNVDIADDLFRLPPPEGMTPEPADC